MKKNAKEDGLLLPLQIFGAIGIIGIDLIKQYFPNRVYSLDDFIRLVDEMGGTSVTAECRYKEKNTLQE